jgi:clan AA aspartic protease (TIGR02281 family)
MIQMRLSLPPRALENVIVLNVRINDQTLIPMLLDTGAKYTVISAHVARRLRIEDRAHGRHVSVVTASQLMRLPLIQLSRVDVHGVALADVETVVTDLPVALGVEGLLGMSFLRYCRLTLDGPEKTIEISVA